MVGIDLGEHDPALRMGHRVTLEARERGAIVRPLGNTVVLMPPLSISEDELRELIAITADSIRRRRRHGAGRGADRGRLIQATSRCDGSPAVAVVGA